MGPSAEALKPRTIGELQNFYRYDWLAKLEAMDDRVSDSSSRAHQASSCTNSLSLIQKQRDVIVLSAVN